MTPISWERTTGTGHLSDGRWLARWSAELRAWPLEPTQWATRGPALLLVTSIVFAAWGLLHSNAAGIGNYGLINALDLTVLVALAGLNVGFAWLVFGGATRGRIPLLVAYVAALSLILNAAPYIIERVPRFPVSYLHAGFAEYIQLTGKTLPGLDARFSWPGFFAAVGLLSRSAGIQPLILIGLFAAVISLIWLLPIGVLVRELLPAGPARWLALWLFCLGDWTGQNYFSPQAVGYFLFLVMVAIVIVWFPDREGAGKNAARAQHVGDGRRLALLGVLLAAFLTVVVSHQLTPFFVITAMSLLALGRRTMLRGLPLLLTVLFLGYVSYLAVAYWSGHLQSIIEQVGNLGGTVDASVGDRVRGGSAHRNVVMVRLLVSAAVWGAAMLGFLRRVRALYWDMRLCLLFVAPFPILAMQSYGGEGLIRAYLFSLPFAAGAAALALVPTGRWTGRQLAATALVALLGTALSTAFFVARYGNEQYEAIRPQEFAAVKWIYDTAPPGSMLTTLAPSVPWRYTGIGRYEHSPALDEFVLGDVRQIRDRMASHHGLAYLLVTNGEGLYATAIYGKPTDWRYQVEQQIWDSGWFRLVYNNRDARVYVLAGARVPGRPHSSDRRPHR
jgi:hypothetical protein